MDHQQQDGRSDVEADDHNRDVSEPHGSKSSRDRQQNGARNILPHIYAAVDTRLAAPMLPLLSAHPPRRPQTPRLPLYPAPQSLGFQRMQGPAPLFASSRVPPPPPPLERPLQLFAFSDFELLRTLGTGTFGRVRLARYVTAAGAEKFFAMKIMRKSAVVRMKQERHVMSERWLLARLNFPFIVRMYGAYQDARSLYLLLEYVIGGELYSYLRRATRFPTSVARFYAAEILLAIEYLHGLGIAYRDLKPENLLLDARGHIKLSDFGFAKAVSDRTWTLCGTPEYLAPEVIHNCGHGRAVDWWALGVLIYEMIAGHPPFVGKTPMQVYERIVAGRLEFDAAKFDPYAIDLIRRLLAPDPAYRLGNQPGGAQDIRMHLWFAGVDWTGLYRKSINAPIQPYVRAPGDTDNFDSYDEHDGNGASDCGSDDDSYRGSKLDPYVDIFRNF